MKQYKVATIAGDGIGKEVMPAGVRVLQRVADQHDFKVNFIDYPWSCETYHASGKMMPDDGIDQLSDSDAIYLGAVGFPGVADHISLWGLLIPIRRNFDQYINLRPIRLLKGVTSPLAGRTTEDIDFYVVRENSEGEYSSIGGRHREGTDDETVIKTDIFTRRGVDRVMKYAFDLAMTRDKKHLTSATKSNGILHTMPFWDERFAELSKHYPAIRADQYHVDILAANFVLHPDWFDVVVGSNLFGDILSDLGPAIAGTIGIAPSANINPEGKYPSMFEPVHGSAPDIAGKGIANPIGQIWSGAMMLEHLGEHEAANRIVNAIEAVLQDKRALTPDMAGQATTESLANAIVDAL